MDSPKSRQAVWPCLLLIACQAPSGPATDEGRPSTQGPSARTPRDTAPSPRQEAHAWKPQDGIDALLHRVEEGNPHVLRARQVWMAAVEQEPQARALPDPWVHLRGYVASVETRGGPMDGQVGLSQPIPWPGKLDAAGEVAASEAEVARWQVEVERLRVRSAFLGHWTEVAYLQEALAILDAQVLLLEYVEEVSLRLYESSRATQADVLRARAERLEMQDRRATLQEKVQALQPLLEGILGASMDPSGDWSGLRIPDVPDLTDRDSLAHLFSSSSPAMIRLQHAWKASEAARRVADLEGRPDLALGADWTWIGQGNAVGPDAGDDAFAISLSMEIPLQRSRIAAQRRQALARQQGVLADLEATRWDLTSRLDVAWSDLEDANRRRDLYREQLLPLGEQTYETTLAAYQAGQSGFQDMLDAARVVLDFRLSAKRAQADAHRAYAALHGLLPHTLLLTENLER